MSTVLLDTNIVSYLFKRDSRAALYAPHLLDRELAVSMMLDCRFHRKMRGLPQQPCATNWHSSPIIPMTTKPSQD